MIEYEAVEMALYRGTNAKCSDVRLDENRKSNRHPKIRKSCDRRLTQCRPNIIRIADRAHCLQRASTVRGPLTDAAVSNRRAAIAFTNLQQFSETIGNCDKSVCLHAKIQQV
jgi:hypothetical protein